MTQEIEYTIKQLESMLDAASSVGCFEDYNALNASLTLCRAELARQDARPLTWNERINQMTVEEKVLLFDSIISCMDCPAKTEWCNGNGRCNEALTLLLHRLYTEGETK